MGSKKVIKQIRKRAVLIFVLGFILFISSVPLALYGFFEQEFGMAIFLTVTTIVSLLIMIFGVMNFGIKKSIF